MNPPPPVWKWYRYFCFALAIGSVGIAALGVAMLVDVRLFESQTFGPEVIRQVGVLALVTGILFAVLNMLMPRLPIVPWAWVTHLINLLVPMTLCCPIVVCLPLCRAWLRPETKAWFGVDH